MPAGGPAAERGDGAAAADAPGCGREDAWAAALVALAGLAAYGNAFDVPFHFDDFRNIVDNPAVADAGYFADAGRARELPGTLDFGTRKFGFLTFWANRRAAGLDPPAWHAVNLAIHVACAVVAGLLARTLAGATRTRPGTARTIGVVAALLFVLHPLQTQAVTYVVQRFTSLAALLYLAALLCYVRSRGAGGPRRAASYGASLAAAFLASRTKEFTLTLPLAVVLVEACLFDGRRRRFLACVPFALIAASIPFAMLGDAKGAAAIASLRVHTDISRLDFLMTELGVVCRYLRMLVLPAGQTIEHAVAVQATFLSAGVLVPLAALLALAACGVWAVVRGARTDGRIAVAGFGVLWFLVTIAPEAGLVPIADLANEHRAYLPSFGVFLAAASLGSLAIERAAARRRRAAAAARAAFAALVVVLAGATRARNEVWRTETGLWEDAAEKNPRSVRVRNTLGCAYLGVGRVGDALREFAAAIEIDPAHDAAWFNLGVCHERRASESAAAGALDDAACAARMAVLAFGRARELGGAVGTQAALRLTRLGAAPPGSAPDDP